MYHNVSRIINRSPETLYRLVCLYTGLDTCNPYMLAGIIVVLACHNINKEASMLCVCSLSVHMVHGTFGYVRYVQMN